MKINIENYIDVLPKKSRCFNKLSDAILLPRFIQLEDNLYAAVFNIMKLLPAKHIINEAIKRNEIQENCTIVDTSSGTFALGIGIICAELGLPFRIFGDPAIDHVLIERLYDLGGQVHISRNPKSPGAYQALRLEALNNFISSNQLSFWARQYDNLDNSRSYSIVAERLMDTLGHHCHIVGAVGSGGSTSGIIKTMREKNANVQLIGVDTFNSVLFGQLDGKRVLRGLGNSIMPKNLDHTAYDEVHWVSANDAFHYTRRLFNQKVIFCGPTTGAAYQVARYLAHRNKKESYVFIAPDEGYRYLTTVYNNQWLENQDDYSKNITPSPLLVTNPLDAVAPWAYMKWDRKSYYQVMGRNFE